MHHRSAAGEPSRQPSQGSRVSKLMKATRRSFLRSATAASISAAWIARSASIASAAADNAAADAGDKLVLSAPLTHSDWMLRPNIPWGDAGVRHMLDQCKACGWSRVYWRVFDAGRATYASKLMKRGLEHEPDSIFS